MRTEETTIFTVILIASLFISFFITVFIYFLYKNQKKLQRTKNSLFRLQNNINEEERKKITLELHNDIIPTLSGIKLRLTLSSQIENTVNQACISELEKSINEIRNLSKRISPMTIYDRTFSSSLRSYIQSTGADQKIKIEIIEKETINLSAEKNALIYRLLQEVLLNTIKHSKASEFKIEVSIDKNNLLIRTADDGVGYELKNN